MRALGAALGLMALPGAALAQGDCFPGKSSNEAKTLAIFSVPLAFSPAAAPGGDRGVSFRLEAATLPNVDDETATPTICRPGKGPENTDLLPGFLRPRVQARFQGGFGIEASWVPPVRVSGVKANLVGLALGWTRGLSDQVTLGIRAHTTLGQVNAPITCPDEALADSQSECFEGTESDDRYRPGIVGADATLGFVAAGGRLRPYVGAGYNHLRPRFQVNFVNRNGELDDRRVAVDLNRAVLFGGLTWRPRGALAVSGEVYTAPADAVALRLVGALGR